MTWPSEPVAARVAVDPLADLGDGRLDEVGGRPGGRDARDPGHEVAQDVLAARRVDDLGVELDAVQVPLRGGEARRRASSRSGRWRGSPPGRRVIESPWLIQTGCSRSMPVNRPSSRVICTVAGPYSRLAGRQDVAAQLEGHQLGAVADPEHGQAAAPDRGVGLGGALVVDRHRAAGQDDRADAAPLQLGERRVVGQELGVDVELADPARDQLGELASRSRGPRRRPGSGTTAATGGSVGARSGAGASSATSRYASTSASSGARTRWPALAASPWMVLPRWVGRLGPPAARLRRGCLRLLGLGQWPLLAVWRRFRGSLPGGRVAVRCATGIATVLLARDGRLELASGAA